PRTSIPSGSAAPHGPTAPSSWSSASRASASSERAGSASHPRELSLRVGQIRARADPLEALHRARQVIAPPLARHLAELEVGPRPLVRAPEPARLREAPMERAPRALLLAREPLRDALAEEPVRARERVDARERLQRADGLPRGLRERDLLGGRRAEAH